MRGLRIDLDAIIALLERRPSHGDGGLGRLDTLCSPKFPARFPSPVEPQVPVPACQWKWDGVSTRSNVLTWTRRDYVLNTGE